MKINILCSEATNSIDDCNACFLSVKIKSEQFFKSTDQYPTIHNLTDLNNNNNIKVKVSVIDHK